MPLPSPSLFPGTEVFPGSGLHDYEVPNGTEVIYRARAIHILAAEAGLITGSASDWTTADHISWNSRVYWMKHPTRPSLNVPVEWQTPASDGLHKDARQTAQQPIGAVGSVVISDTRAPETGLLVVNTRSEEERLLIEELATEQAPVLLQARPQDNYADRWVMLGAQDSQRVVDRAYIADGTITYAWTAVEVPEGALVEF